MGNRRGFTLIELMLAIAFISMLLLAIAAVGIQVGRIYTRGIVLRDVKAPKIGRASCRERV